MAMFALQDRFWGKLNWESNAEIFVDKRFERLQLLQQARSISFRFKWLSGYE